MATDTFISWTYSNCEFPPYDHAQLGADGLDYHQLLSRCATNYLLKNMWHNYVHNRLQGINESNYRKFAGLARRQSDFEADNLSTILLARSYGLPIEASGLLVPNKEILTMLRRNRCNRVFAERADKMDETLSPWDALEDSEWRYCRVLATYISGWLLAQGRAVASLAVHLVGKTVRRATGRFLREDGRIVVEVNGIRIATGERAQANRFGKSGLAKEVREERHEHSRTVAQVVSQQYGVLLDQDSGLRNYARRVLKEKLRWAGVEV